MTYSILSLASGNILESYNTPERVYEAAARIVESEPEAEASLAVVAFDEQGMLIETVDGDELHERLDSLKPANAAPA